MSDNDSQREQDHGRRGAWLGGVILILVGLVLLAQNYGFYLPRNWWAFFILIPAFASFNGALRSYRRNGNRFTAGTVAPLVTGIVLTLVTLVFLFDLTIEWGIMWPWILIVIGVIAIARSYWRW
jgi:hypothetical protein